MVCATGRINLRRTLFTSSFCIEASGRFRAAETAPLVRRIESTRAAINPDADPSTSGSRNSVSYTVAELAGRKVLVAPPIDHREARNIFEPGKPVKTGFCRWFSKLFTMF